MRSRNFRLGADKEEERLVDVARDKAGGKSSDGSDTAVKARFLRLVDRQRLRVVNREPSRTVRPLRGDSAPLRDLAWGRPGSMSPSLRKPMSYSK